MRRAQESLFFGKQNATSLFIRISAGVSMSDMILILNHCA